LPHIFVVNYYLLNYKLLQYILVLSGENVMVFIGNSVLGYFWVIFQWVKQNRQKMKRNMYAFKE